MNDPEDALELAERMDGLRLSGTDGWRALVVEAWLAGRATGSDGFFAKTCGRLGIVRGFVCRLVLISRRDMSWSMQRTHCLLPLATLSATAGSDGFFAMT